VICRTPLVASVTLHRSAALLRKIQPADGSLLALVSYDLPRGIVRIVSRRMLVSIGLSLLSVQLFAAELPHIKIENGVGQLIVNGQPFLILGGELGNSSAGTAAQADTIYSQLAVMHVNTILMPVAWEQIEPNERSFD